VRARRIGSQHPLAEVRLGRSLVAVDPRRRAQPRAREWLPGFFARIGFASGPEPAQPGLDSVESPSGERDGAPTEVVTQPIQQRNSAKIAVRLACEHPQPGRPLGERPPLELVAELHSRLIELELQTPFVERQRRAARGGLEQQIRPRERRGAEPGEHSDGPDALAADRRECRVRAGHQESAFVRERRIRHARHLRDGEGLPAGREPDPRTVEVTRAARTRRRQEQESAPDGQFRQDPAPWLPGEVRGIRVRSGRLVEQLHQAVRGHVRRRRGKKPGNGEEQRGKRQRQLARAKVANEGRPERAHL
jgi:hypothetical protein